MRRALIGFVLLAAPGCAAIPAEPPTAVIQEPEIREIDLRQAQVFCFEKRWLLAAIRIDKDGEIMQARCVPLRRAERDS